MCPLNRRSLPLTHLVSDPPHFMPSHFGPDHLKQALKDLMDCGKPSKGSPQYRVLAALLGPVPAVTGPGGYPGSPASRLNDTFPAERRLHAPCRVTLVRTTSSDGRHDTGKRNPNTKRTACFFLGQLRAATEPGGSLRPVPLSFGSCSSLVLGLLDLGIVCPAFLKSAWSFCHSSKTLPLRFANHSRRSKSPNFKLPPYFSHLPSNLLH